MIEDHDLVSPWLVLTGREHAPQRWLDPEQREKICGHLQSSDAFGGLAGFHEVERFVILRGNELKSGTLSLVIQKVGGRVMGFAPPVPGILEELDQLLRGRVG